VTEPKPIDPAQNKICYYLLGAGAMLFALGAYTGFALHGKSVLVFFLLGASITLFASAFFAGLKQHTNEGAYPGKVPPQPQAEVASEADAKPQNPQDAEVVILMKTTLGELLLAAARKDPEGAQQLFARAGLQAKDPTGTAPAGEARDHSSS
jgi:hypothetical protein